MTSRNHGSEPQEVSEAEALLQAHLAAVAWIENHLLEPMTVKSIADRAGYSPSRFSRGFTRLQGFFHLEHRVYGREDTPCLVCRSPIKRVVIAARSSHYCPKCQK